MELISLHPFDPAIAERYISALRGEHAPDPAWSSWWSPALGEDVAGVAAGSEDAANRVTLGLAWALSAEHPAFVREGFGLTTWEARIDRGIGMLMRPPSRIFADAGMERAGLQAMPIRLEVESGMMGGAYIPPRLIGQMADMFDQRLERLARRMKDADYDPYPMLALLHAAIAYAHERELGLYEAQDAVGGPAPMRIIEAPDRKSMDPVLRERIKVALAPEKKGFFSRLFGRQKDS
jgi:hypothetical protein